MKVNVSVVQPKRLSNGEIGSGDPYVIKSFRGVKPALEFAQRVSGFQDKRWYLSKYSFLEIFEVNVEVFKPQVDLIAIYTYVDGVLAYKNCKQ